MTGINHSLISRNLNLINSESTNSNNTKSSSSNAKSFQEIFNNQSQANIQTNTNNIQFSKHATMRLGSRNMKLDSSQIKRVEEGVAKANEKGIKDSLVLVDDIALVVNVRSKTVITAIENDSEKVYSNIDGAVIV